MKHTQIHDTPSDVTTGDGQVVVDGPDGVAVTFTPEAAVATAARLLDAAATAHGDFEIERDLQDRRRKSADAG